MDKSFNFQRHPIPFLHVFLKIKRISPLWDSFDISFFDFYCVRLQSDHEKFVAFAAEQWLEIRDEDCEKCFACSSSKCFCHSNCRQFITFLILLTCFFLLLLQTIPTIAACELEFPISQRKEQGKWVVQMKKSTCLAIEILIECRGSQWWNGDQLRTWIVISLHSRHCTNWIRLTIHDRACINVCIITLTTTCRHHTRGNQCGMRDRMKAESVMLLIKSFSFEFLTQSLQSSTDSEFIESPYHIYGRLPSSRETSSRGYISSNSGAFRNSQQQLNYIGDWEWCIGHAHIRYNDSKPLSQRCEFDFLSLTWQFSSCYAKKEKLLPIM